MKQAVVVQQDELPDFEPVLVNSDLVRLEAVRYLFFPGDVIGSRRKQERADLRHGGEEIGSACLVRTNRFLRRCRITPLERWGDPMPQELMPTGAVPIGLLHQDEMKGQSRTSFEVAPLQAFQKFPGEEITWILASADNSGMRKGIVELTPLREMEWNEFSQTGIQQLFFPEYPKLPPTLREIEESIRTVDSRDSHIVQLKNETLASCSQFRLWGTARMDLEDTLIKIGAVGAWVHTYSELADTLIPQLERGRADQYLHNQQNIQAVQVDQQARLTDAVVEALGRNKADQIDVGGLVAAIQDQTRAMLEQNRESMAALLQKHFGSEDKDAPKENGSNKPKPGNRTT
jgi:hypothetical protein